MGLITKEVEVTLVGVNIPYYENMGYKIPRVQRKWGMSVPRNTKIKVKIEDVSYGSDVNVDVFCDACGKEYVLSYAQYYKHNHDGKCYCHTCANKLFNSGENHSKWRSDLSEEERQIGRNYPEYTQFIKRVYERDNYTCQCCGILPHHSIPLSFISAFLSSPFVTASLMMEERYALISSSICSISVIADSIRPTLKSKYDTIVCCSLKFGQGYA